MSDFSDFDDDDDFIALTLKPPRAATVEPSQRAAAKPPQPPQLRQDATIDSTQISNQELNAARGEIAVLRSKLQELEKQKFQERQELVAANRGEAQQNESKIKALESTVKRLEDERKFLSVEIKNLNSRKRKKPNQTFSDSDTSMSEAAVVNTPSARPEPDVTPNPPVKRPALQTETVAFKSQPVSNGDNSLLIDVIMNHSIVGASQPSFEYLSKICLVEDYNSKWKIPQDEPISTHLLNFLLLNRDIYRLDELITLLIETLMGLIDHLLRFKDKRRYLPVPFLLSITQAVVLYRPSALSKRVVKSLVLSLVNKLTLFSDLLKPEEIFGEYYERHKKIAINVIQIPLLEKMILQYNLELLETVLMNLDVDDQLNVRFNQMLYQEINSTMDQFIKLALSKNSNINLIYSVIEILNYMCDSFETEEELPLVNSEVLETLLLYLDEEFPTRDDWFLSGINRLMGNNDHDKLIDDLVTRKLNKHPCVVYPIEFKTDKVLFSITNKHNFQFINLQLRILNLLEKMVLNNKAIVDYFYKNTEYLKRLTMSIAKQQQHVMKVPRSNLTPLRSKYISAMLRTLQLIWETTTASTEEESPLLPKDITYILMIVLSRVSFSSSNISDESADFLYRMRTQSLSPTPVFNRWAEQRAREIGHANYLSEDMFKNHDAMVKQVVAAECGLSNGVEFAYDDDVVDLAREMLEKCSTMDEADAMFLAMNAPESV